MGRQCLQADDSGPLWLPSMRKDLPGLSTLFESVGRLYVAGAELDWRGFDAPWPRTRVALPAYPFNRKRYWIDTASIAALEPVRSTNATADGSGAYEVLWRKATESGARPETDRGSWIVVAPQDELRSAVCERLESLGARCTVVPHGQISGAKIMDILSSDAAAGVPLRGVVYLPSRGSDAHSAADQGLLSSRIAEDAGALMRSVATTPEAALRLFIVTRDAVSPSGSADHPLAVAQAALWGAGRTFALEHPALWGGLLDVSSALESGAAATAIVDELFRGSTEDQVAIRAEGRYVPRLVRLEPTGGAPLSMKPDRTYLVTGGLGAIGAHVAEWLVSRGARNLVLTGRRAAAVRR